MNNRSNNSQSICVHNKLSDNSKVAKFLAAYIASNNIPDEILDELRLVAEETFINIISHAFSNGETHAVSIEINKTDDEISITFSDGGVAFNPLTECNNNLDTDDHSEGGMGIHIIRSLTDEQEYHRVEQRNVFTVTKHYTKQNIKQ